MRVSIITATYNSAATIKDTILSVKNQTYHNVEHIVVDGQSTDNTLHLVNHFGHQGPILSEPDKGIYDAMNKGVKIAGGEIVGILNSDDFYPHNGVIENVVKAFESGDCDAVYGDLIVVDPYHIKRVLRKWIAGVYSRKLFYKGWMPPHPTFFVKKEIYEKFGSFNIDFKCSSDYELLLRFMLLNNIKVQYLPGVLVHMRAGGCSNKTFKHRLVAHMEDYRAWKTNGLSPKWYTIAMKPLSKVKQYLAVSRLSQTNKVLVNAFLTPTEPSNQL
ncbi:glycosyltransferase family 2 protein [Segetibacter koreensis]|uniref:glycosyltransferase family 2 protein n=1 Tax=Segetibacter koreensis TaxID=398037 RepID=UPI000378D30F|nr:glycosyltransferase family 2 protein [Segetibacter koreensis]